MAAEAQAAATRPVRFRRTEHEKETFKFGGEWAEAFGEPERNGVWFIWGRSGSGKTTFVLQLCKELARFGRVAYDSLEEGTSLTMKNAFAWVWPTWPAGSCC